VYGGGGGGSGGGSIQSNDIFIFFYLYHLWLDWQFLLSMADGQFQCKIYVK
jgi:hypothetical protein